MIRKKQRWLVLAPGEVWYIVRGTGPLLWSVLRVMSWSCFLSLCHTLRCPCLMLVFCEMTYVQQENNTAMWWVPAQLEDQNVHPNVWDEGDLSSVYKWKGFFSSVVVQWCLTLCNPMNCSQASLSITWSPVIFENIIYQHTRELKRYSSIYKNKEFMFSPSFPIHSSALLRNKCS